MTSRSRGAGRDGRRVNQLDSQMIDGELEDTLLEPMLSSLDGVVEDAWKERIALALKLTLLFCSLRASLPAAGRSSYGARLENLKWVHAATGNNISNKQVLLYTLLSILPSYFHAKARDGMLSLGWADEPSSGHWRTSLSERHRRRTCWEMAERVDLLLRFAQVVNLLIFLHRGGARTLVERALRIRLVPASRELQRAVPFEFLSRQIVWQALTDFILFLLPLVDLRRLRVRLKSVKQRVRTGLVGTGRASEEEATERALEKRKKARVARGECAICVDRKIARVAGGIPDPAEPALVQSSSASASASSTRNPSDTALKLPYQADCCGARYCFACLLPDIIRWRELHLNRPWVCWACLRQPARLHRWDGSHSAPN
ncbi:hypothetical protein PCANC_22340 [Puccinia coronata f. sp. avenae]|uniref:Pex N-terminal domain-containing protein n=1 Tax=Puccinia coronata f. sp. avenae TaxID=200324 RepID=A0A2N5SAN0_9BASI|nr:hypothetical protein PCANC_22340 [Puccinia coronata f. sp. avenae]